MEIEVTLKGVYAAYVDTSYDRGTYDSYTKQYVFSEDSLSLQHLIGKYLSLLRNLGREDVPSNEEMFNALELIKIEGKFIEDNCSCGCIQCNSKEE